jgi:GT2 family glycosyltransferase
VRQVTRISVIIPTRGDAGRLKRCLSALAVSFPPVAETIVVGDGTDVEVEALVEGFVESLRLRSVRTPHGGPARARNRGLAMARGDIVAFTDDDCRPRPGWVEVLAQQVRLSPPRAVGGTTFNGLESNPYADAAQVVLDLVARHDRAAFGAERFFCTNNCAFPAAALRQLGGFNEAFRTAEDRELCRRWRGAGFALTRVPEAVVDHDANPDLVAFLRKFFAYGRGAARFHANGNGQTFRDVAAFHLRLPMLLGPEAVRRGPRRGAGLVGLIALWEFANLAGFIAERVGVAGRERRGGNGTTRPAP